jgi:hypothetical protein
MQSDAPSLDDLAIGALQPVPYRNDSFWHQWV